MHGCEALIAAHVATGEQHYLNRAIEIAEFLCFRSARTTKDFVYEHFNPSWEPDYLYNEGDFSDLYRPWGFQPGHQTEWAKLLMQLFALTKEAKIAVRAQEMFDKAVGLATDQDFGGLVYGLDPELRICNPDKYFWVQIESAAACYKLAQWSGESRYLERYDELWRICWSHFVDHKSGSWFRQLTKDFQPLAPNKGTGGKDYHVIGACHDMLGFDGQ
jgi:mannose/cellobiose epimerase-like protein (N-acyl-D-glucosamine 2-epimerase family)